VHSKVIGIGENVIGICFSYFLITHTILLLKMEFVKMYMIVYGNVRNYIINYSNGAIK